MVLFQIDCILFFARFSYKIFGTDNNSQRMNGNYFKVYREKNWFNWIAIKNHINAIINVVQGFSFYFSLRKNCRNWKVHLFINYNPESLDLYLLLIFNNFFSIPKIEEKKLGNTLFRLKFLWKNKRLKFILKVLTFKVQKKMLMKEFE